jgi:hypothetical protein
VPFFNWPDLFDRPPDKEANDHDPLVEEGGRKVIEIDAGGKRGEKDEFQCQRTFRRGQERRNQKKQEGQKADLASI